MSFSRVLAIATVLAWIPLTSLQAAELPAPTVSILKSLKVEEAILAGIDDELKVPDDWLRKAKEEKALSIIGAWDPPQFEALVKPFRARYPEVQLSYVRGGLYDRGVKPLMALKAGRHIVDMIISPGDDWAEFARQGLLEDLRDVPNFAKLPAEMRSAKGDWAGQKVAYRCLAYNKNLIKKDALPKTWEELITTKALHNGQLGMPNRPNLWLSMLWLAKGPDWTKDFMEKVFRVVKPQLRKEGANAMLGLLAAGEFRAVVAAAEYRVQQRIDRGAPIGYHCPEPIPVAISLLLVLKDNPHRHSSLLFANWFLSREGQIAQFAANQAIPVRGDLAKRREFMPFPEEVLGKKLALRDEAALRPEFPKLIAYYDPLWKQAGGDKLAKSSGDVMVTVSGKIKEIQRSGRILVLDVDGKDVQITVSGRRTAISVNGSQADRASLKSGMVCKVSRQKAGGSAATISCKAS